MPEPWSKGHRYVAREGTRSSVAVRAKNHQIANLRADPPQMTAITDPFLFDEAAADLSRQDGEAAAEINHGHPLHELQKKTNSPRTS